jgi:hypothetical protein
VSFCVTSAPASKRRAGVAFTVPGACSRSPAARRHFGGSLESCIIGPVKTVARYFLTTLAGIVFLGYGYSVPASGATTKAPPITLRAIPSLAQADNLGPITCSSTSRCLAIEQSPGDESGVLITDNGGTTWTLNTQLGVPDGFACPTTLSCISPDGAAFGDNPTHMLKTQNGGRSWYKERILTHAVPLGYMDCPTLRFCVAGGGLTTWSIDGGLMWHASAGLPTGTYLDDISCTSSGLCLAYSIGGRSESPGTYQSTDFGKQWVAGSVPTGSYDSLDCVGNSTCYVTANDPTGNPTAASLVFSTADAGQSWKTRIAPAPGMATISCAAPNSCLLANDSTTCS